MASVETIPKRNKSGIWEEVVVVQGEGRGQRQKGEIQVVSGHIGNWWIQREQFLICLLFVLFIIIINGGHLE